MSAFKIGDRVEIIEGIAKGRTGEIVRKVDAFNDFYDIKPDGEPNPGRRDGLYSKFGDRIRLIEKPAFAIGQKVRVLKDMSKAGYYHKYEKGEIVKIVEDANDHQPYIGERADGSRGNWLFEKEVELVDVPAATPEKETKRMFLANDQGYDITNGKLYEITDDDVDVDSTVRIVDDEGDGQWVTVGEEGAIVTITFE